MVKQEDALKSKVVDHFKLTIESGDETPDKVWKLCYDYQAIAKMEDALALNVMNPTNWEKTVSGTNFPKVVWAGLTRFNPEVTQEEVLSVLNPGLQVVLELEIFKLLHPVVWESWQKKSAKGEPQVPNAETATPTS